MNKEDPYSFEVISGKKRIKIEHDGYSLNLSTMKNGWQWVGTLVDDEMLDMIIECIDKYKNKGK